MKVNQNQFRHGPITWWIDILPYQFALGFTIRYGSDFSPAIRLYAGPLKMGAFWNS